MKRAITAALGAAVLGAALLAGPASAATSGCAGVPGGQCGSQEINPGGGVGLLMMAAHNNAVIGSALEVKAASNSNATEDFLGLQPPNQPAQGSVAYEYAPNGVASGLCVQGGASGTSPTLQTCAISNFNQQWIASTAGSGYTLRLRSTAQVLTDPNGGPAFTNLVTSDPDSNDADEVWTFNG